MIDKHKYIGVPFIPIIMIAVCIAILVILETMDNTTILMEVLKDLIIAVLASYIFAFSLNIPFPLLINDKLVIRHMESQAGNPISLSLLIGNPYKRILGGVFDVKFTFVYKIVSGSKSNKAVSKTVERVWIDDYFRASIDFTKMAALEKQFWSDYWNKDNKDNKSSIIVIISGESNRFGGHFRFLKEYTVDDIIVGEDCFGALDKKEEALDIINGKLKDSIKQPQNREKRYWKAFRQYYQYDENIDDSKEKIKELFE